MKERRFSKRATILAIIAIAVLTVFLVLSIWFAFSVLLSPPPTKP